ncbi:MAG: class I SAM-dependent methyltransferase [Patescibacteria group bacterium]
MSHHQDFWNKEYKSPKHLALSEQPSEDLEKFARWVARAWEKEPQAILGIDANSLVVDMGCGNGRNMVYFAKTFGCRAIGYDISGEAIRQAKSVAEKVDAESKAEDGNASVAIAPLLTFEARSIEGTFPELADESVDVVLDMMSSHFLNEAQRVVFRDEVARILKPGGWFFFKTFCADGDLHTKRLLRDNPAGEAGSYIHPKFGLAEHVWTEEEIDAFFGEQFEIKKLEKSHRHILNGRAFKRRTVTAYLERKW